MRGLRDICRKEVAVGKRREFAVGDRIKILKDKLWYTNVKAGDVLVVTEVSEYNVWTGDWIFSLTDSECLKNIRKMPNRRKGVSVGQG